MKTLVSTMAGLTLLFLGGCYESPNVTTYEPGVYKGPKDPLMMGKADQRAETLKKRFELVQMDR